MSHRNGHLFVVKADAFVTELRRHLEQLETHGRDCRGAKVGPEDGMIRMVLSTPEVSSAIRRQYQVADFRARLAFAGEPPAFGFDRAYLEIYDVDGKPITEPTAAEELDEALGNAVQVELLHFLLKCRGLDIPML